MSREETKELFKKIMVVYPSFNPVDLSEAVNMWAKALEKCPYKDVLKKLDKYIVENKYPPTIADLHSQGSKDNTWYRGRNYTAADFEEFEKMALGGNQ